MYSYFLSNKLDHSCFPIIPAVYLAERRNIYTSMRELLNSHAGALTFLSIDVPSQSRCKTYLVQY